MSTLKKLRSSALQKRKTTIRTAGAKAAVKPISPRRLSSPFITQHDVDAACHQMSDEQRVRLRDARIRILAVLARPDMAPDALRARAKHAAEWENTHGVIGPFVGALKR